MTNNTLAILVVLNVLFFIWSTVLTILYVSAVRHYKSLRIEKGESLQSVIKRIYGTLGKFNQKHETALNIIGEIRKDTLKHVQKVALKRFNPFGDTGGDQSFSMALLDKRGDGVVLSSLHGRAGTRIYAKPVEGGRPVAYEFSDEEAEVVDLALSEDEK